MPSASQFMQTSWNAGRTLSFLLVATTPPGGVWSTDRGFAVLDPDPAKLPGGGSLRDATPKPSPSFFITSPLSPSMFVQIKPSARARLPSSLGTIG
jgi:hypothetical protein